MPILWTPQTTQEPALIQSHYGLFIFILTLGLLTASTDMQDKMVKQFWPSTGQGFLGK